MAIFTSQKSGTFIDYRTWGTIKSYLFRESAKIGKTLKRKKLR